MLNSLREKKAAPLTARLSVQIAALAATGVLGAAPAHAALSDTLHPFGGISYNYDDNLLRLQDVDGQSTEGRSDTYRTAYAGLNLDRTVGLQRFVVSWQVNKVQFQRFDVLDYTAKQFNGNWYWALGTHLSGTLGAYYTESLPAFSDFHSPQRNLRTARGQNFDLRYRFHPSWQVRGHVDQSDTRNDLAAQAYLDRDGHGSNVGFDYLAASGSTIGFQVGRNKVDYLHPRTISGVVYNQNYYQDEAKLKVSWAYSPVTQIEFLGGWARRRNEFFTTNDSSGADGRLVVDWSPASAVKLTGNLWREYTPFDGAGIFSYSHDTGASVSGTWSVHARVRLNADVRYLKRDLESPTNSVALADAQDDYRRASMGASYVFHDSLSLTLSVFRESRSSNTVYSNRYRSNGASLTANVQF